MKISSRAQRQHRTRQEKIQRLSNRLFRLGQAEFRAHTIMLDCGQKMPCNLPYPQERLAQIWKLRAVLLRRIGRL